jgi:hypothetical protein
MTLTMSCRSVLQLGTNRLRLRQGQWAFRARPPEATQVVLRLPADKNQPAADSELYCMFTSESSSGVLRQIKIMYELKEGNPRDWVYGPCWTSLGNGSG